MSEPIGDDRLLDAAATRLTQEIDLFWSLHHWGYKTHELRAVCRDALASTSAERAARARLEGRREGLTLKIHELEMSAARASAAVSGTQELCGRVTIEMKRLRRAVRTLDAGLAIGLVLALAALLYLVARAQGLVP